MDISHLDEKGAARMVDISGKAATSRYAKAGGDIYLADTTIEAIKGNLVAKGDVIAVARVAGIMAAKRCAELIPLCHPIPIDSISIDMRLLDYPSKIEIEAEVACRAGTGAEMEALTAVSVCALTIYDMVKAIDRGAVIGDIRLLEKSGGKSGIFKREDDICKEE